MASRVSSSGHILKVQSSFAKAAKAAHAWHHRQFAAKFAHHLLEFAELPHHLLHVLEAFDEVVHVADQHAAALGDALTPLGIQDRG